MRGGRNPMGRASLADEDGQARLSVRKLARSRLRDAGRKGAAIASMSYNASSAGGATSRRASSADDSLNSILPTWLTDFGLLADRERNLEIPRQQQDAEEQEESWWASLEQGVKDVSGEVFGHSAEDEEEDAERVFWENERDMLLGKSRIPDARRSRKQVVEADPVADAEPDEQVDEADSVADAESDDMEVPSSSTVVQTFQSQKQLAIREERSRIQLEEDALRNEIQQQELQIYAVGALDKEQLLNSARAVRRATLATSRGKHLAKEQESRALRMIRMENLGKRICGSKHIEDARLARCVEAAQEAFNAETNRLDVVFTLDPSGAIADRTKWALQHECQASLRGVAECGDVLRKLRPSLIHASNRRKADGYEIRDPGLDPARRRHLAQQYLNVLEAQAPVGAATVHTRFGTAYTHWSDSGMRLQ